MTLRYLSVCSGIEAASVAWGPLGFQAAGFAEIDPAASRVLAHHYGSNLPGEPPSANGVPNFGDFTTLDPVALGPVDILVGGTPCQAFSVAGKRLSLAEARGKLSLAYTVLAHGLARHAGLRWAVWENVPGVLSTRDNAFGCFLGALVGGDDAVEPLARPKRGKSNAFWRWRDAATEREDDGNDVVVPAGHVTRWPRAGMAAGPFGRAAWRVLDAQYFGLAQRRRRVFVVAGFGEGGGDPAAVLFEPQGVRRHPPTRGEARETVARPLSAGSPGGSGYRNDADTAENLIDLASVAKTLLARQNLAHRDDQDTLVPLAFGGNNTSGAIEVATAVNAHGGPNGRLDFESETFVTHALQWAVRRLMPLECERLQGFPDGYTAIPGAADGPRYRQLGNSMPVPVIAWIGARIAAQGAPR